MSGHRRRREIPEPEPATSQPQTIGFCNLSWVMDLLDAFEAIDDGSMANEHCYEVAQIRTRALNSLDAIVTQLRRHPGFPDRFVDPLDLLATALTDDPKHPILKFSTGRRGRRGRATKRDTNYRRNILVAVRVLEAAGMALPDAYKRVAKLLEKAGHHGAKLKSVAGGVSVKTIEGWNAEAAHGSQDANEVNDCMDGLFGLPRKEWPPSLARALRIATAIASDPKLKLIGPAS